MNNFLLSKKIHRLLVLLISALILVMATSGLLLKYPDFVSRSLSFIDLGLLRYIHNRLSPWFGGILTLMALTGLIMYFYPVYARRKIATQRKESDKQT
ncbi:MAG: hypothetical protein WC497_02955 [Patescibacteria group bacterium]